jgi:hypothetical protein
VQYLAKFGLPPSGGPSIEIFDTSAVSKIGDRVAALVAREAQAFVPMIPPPLFVGKSSPLDPPHPAHRASFLERTTLSN